MSYDASRPCGILHLGVSHVWCEFYSFPPIVAGKAKQAHYLGDMMNSHPLHCGCSLKACFIARVFSNWFYEHAVPETVCYKMEGMKEIHMEVEPELEDVDAGIHISHDATGLHDILHLVSTDFPHHGRFHCACTVNF